MTETVVVERLVTDVVQVSSPSEVVVVETTSTETVVVGVAGPQGITGPQGVQGPAGPAGSTYTHHQVVASALWIIPHSLGFNPNVRIEDSAGDQCIGDITDIDVNNLTIAFSAPFAGYAYCS